MLELLAYLGFGCACLTASVIQERRRRARRPSAGSEAKGFRRFLDAHTLLWLGIGSLYVEIIGASYLIRSGIDDSLTHHARAVVHATESTSLSVSVGFLAAYVMRELYDLHSMRADKTRA